MSDPFIGSEAIARGALIKSQLGSRYTRLFRDVYVETDAEVTPALRQKQGGCGPGVKGSRWVIGGGIAR